MEYIRTLHTINLSMSRGEFDFPYSVILVHALLFALIGVEQVRALDHVLPDIIFLSM